MTRRDLLIAGLLIGVGCMQMVGDILGFPVIKALGAATGASPAPKVFTAQNGFETYANRFYLEWHDASAKEHVLELTPESYSGVTGPYNRRNVYGAVISYAPVLESNPLTRLMFRTVLTRSFCGKQPIIAELGVPADAARHGPLRIRLEPRRAPVKHGFRLVHEVRCDG